MGNKVNKIDQVIDTLSWAGLVISWLVAIFLRIVQSYKPGTIGIIGGSDGPTAIFFTNPFFQVSPAIAGTLLFFILTLLLRLTLRSIVGQFFRYLRLIVILAVLALYICLFI